MSIVRRVLRAVTLKRVFLVLFLGAIAEWMLNVATARAALLSAGRLALHGLLLYGLLRGLEALLDRRPFTSVEIKVRAWDPVTEEGVDDVGAEESHRSREGGGDGRGSDSHG